MAHPRWGRVLTCDLRHCRRSYYEKLWDRHLNSRIHKQALRRRELEQRDYVPVSSRLESELTVLGLFKPAHNDRGRRLSRSKRPRGTHIIGGELWVPRELVQVFEYLSVERERARSEALTKVDKSIKRLTKRLIAAVTGEEKWTRPLAKRWKRIRAFVTEKTMVDSDSKAGQKRR